MSKELAETHWPTLVLKHTTGGACNFQMAANDLAEIVSSSRMDGVELNELLKRGAKACGFDLHWHSDGKLDITQKQLEQFAFYLTTAGRRDAL